MTVYAPADPRLPLGVAILAVLTGLAGAFVLIAGLAIVLVAAYVIAAMGWTAMFGSGVLAGLIALVVGGVILAAAAGLWDQEMWAYVLAILVTGGAAIWFIGRPLWDGGGFASIETLPAVISGLLFVYLLAVKNHFG